MKPNDFDPGELSPVGYETTEGRPTLVFTRDLRHPPAAVWRALTDPAELRGWAPFMPDRDLSTPGTAKLAMTDEGATVEFPANVVRATPPNLLEYTWGEDVLTWELTPIAAGTRLTLRHRVGGLEWLSRVAAGWHLCIVVMERMLDGSPIGPIVGRAARDYGWERLDHKYAAKLGVEPGGWPKQFA